MNRPVNANPFPVDVSAAIVTHNAMRTIQVCMQGLDDAGCPHDRITVYDVASTDQTRDWLAQHYPDVPLYCLEENNGPNPARNLAITRSTTPFVLVMDGDVQLLPDTANELHRVIAKDDNIAIATPVVLYSDRPDTVQYSRTWIHYLAEANAEVDDKSLTQLQGRAERVGLASGCAPMIRVDAAKHIDLYEPRYLFGKEDGEFAYRCTIAGFDIIEPASAQVLHHHHKRGSSFFKYQLRNHWHFMLKDYELRTLIAILPILLIHELALFLLMLVMGKPHEFFSAIGSLFKLLPDLPKDRRRIRQLRKRHDWQVLRGDTLVMPGHINEHPGILGSLARCYNGLLCGYWQIARRVLSAISRPLPNDDGLLMQSDWSFSHDVTVDPPQTRVA